MQPADMLVDMNSYNMIVFFSLMFIADYLGLSFPLLPSQEGSVELYALVF